MISMSKADLSRLIVDAVSATLQVHAPSLPAQPRPRIVDVDGLSEEFGWSKSTIYKMTSSNAIPYFKYEGKKGLNFDLDEVYASLKKDRAKTISEIESEAANRVALT